MGRTIRAILAHNGGGMLKFNKSTMIALYAMLELAKAGDASVTSSEIAARHGISVHHLQKVLRELVKRGYLVTARGVRGGHRLNGDPKNITLLNIMEVFEGPRAGPDSCLLESLMAHCDRKGICGLQSVFRELDEQVAFTLGSITLKTLIQNEHKHPVAKSAIERLN